MLEPVSIYSCALPGCSVSQQELQQILLISANFPFGALLKIFVHISNPSIWFVANGCLSSFLIILFQVLQKECCRYLAQSLGFQAFNYLLNTSGEEKNQGVLNYDSLCAACTNRIDCGPQCRGEILAQLPGNNFYVC